jgi:lysophospholipase L1-like esterase
MNPTDEMQPRGSLRIYAVLTLLSIVAAGALGEALVRVRQYVRYGIAGARVSQTVLDPATGLQIPPPGARRGSVVVNSLGFRSPELQPKAQGVRLAFLGGSTTYCAEVSAPEKTWPHLVANALGRAAARPVDYINGGTPGHTTAEMLRNLTARVKPLSPDLVVLYEATNDISMDTRRLAIEQGLDTGRHGEASFAGRYSLLWFLIEFNLEMARAGRQTHSSAGKLAFDARALSAGYAQRLQALGKAAGDARVAIATFAYRGRRGQSPSELQRNCVSSLYYMPYMTPGRLLDAFEAYNDAARRVARESGALLIETADAIPADAAHYNDSVHFTDAGCERMAARVSAALLADNQLQRLIRP